MPIGSEDRINSMYVLLYGMPGLRKTWWAMSAAEYGFNVHVFDGDKGAGIVRQMSQKARSRVNIINCYDKQDRPIFAEFLTRFMQNEKILWDDTENKIVSQLVNRLEAEHAYFQIWSQMLGPNDVVVIDNVRSLIYSILWHHLSDNDTKIEDLDKQDWDAYYIQKTLMETYMTRLRACPGHMVWIAHETVNEITEPGKDAKGQPIRKATGEVVVQPLSSSRATGNVMAGYFDDMLHFELSGKQIYIDTVPSEKRQAKARTFYGRELWENLSFAKYASLCGYTGSHDTVSAGCVYYPAGSISERPGLVRKEMKIAPAATPAPVLGAAKLPEKAGTTPVQQPQKVGGITIRPRS